MSSDDQGVLFFGASEDTSDIIASVPGWTANRQWDKYEEQASAHIELVANDYYFLKAVGSEGGGGDNLAVGVQLPTGELVAPITVENYLFTSSDLVVAIPLVPAVPPQEGGRACRSDGRCSIDECMQGMIQQVTRACCPDPALCPDGAPSTCNERCSAAFTEMYEACP